MTAQLNIFRLPILLLLVVNFVSFSSLFAQIDTPISEPIDTVAPDKKTKNKQKEVSAEKNANDLRKINLLLAIAQDRDRQAGEAVEDIRTRRLHVEDDLAEAEDNPKTFSKKARTDLETQLKSLQKKEKLAQKARETANSFLLEVTQALAAEPTKRSKFISTYERKFGPITDDKTTTPEPPKSDDAFPLVLNENTNMSPPPVETTEPVAEQPVENPKKAKKEPKKTSKKKAKKADTTAETGSKAEDFPVILPENTVIVPASIPTLEPIINNSTTPSSEETTPTNDETEEENDGKTKKKTKKNDKKPKKNTTTETAQGSLVNYKTYNRNFDVFMKSPAPECAIAYDGKDEFTGKNKRETVPSRFFAHTDEVMRKAMQDKDFITCDLTGTKVEGSRYTYLNMTFTVLSKDIQRSLGFLDRGTPIIFVLVNGRKVTMRTNKTDIGVVDIDKGLTIYKAQLIAESITDLTESELDYVRVNWSSGYEDYEVYDVDVLKNLFNCLYKKL